MTGNMRVAEIFHSIQGEGQHAGLPTTFVRTTGCNLRCWFCDTAYTSWEPEGTHRSLEEILAAVAQFDCRQVDITGGEPFLPRDVVLLTELLHERDYFVTIETAGTLFRPVHADLISLSPKLSNSTPTGDRWSGRHDLIRENLSVVTRLISEYEYQLKFVIDQPHDLNEVVDYLAGLPAVRSDCVWLMPQAVSAEQLAEKSGWLVEQAQSMGFHYSPRLHVEQFGNVRGK